jgi:hypothetical protein
VGGDGARRGVELHGGAALRRRDGGGLRHGRGREHEEGGKGDDVKKETGHSYALRTVTPPSTTRYAPVMNDADGSTNARVACATSSGSP